MEYLYVVPAWYRDCFRRRGGWPHSFTNSQTIYHQLPEARRTIGSSNPRSPEPMYPYTHLNNRDCCHQRNALWHVSSAYCATNKCCLYTTCVHAASPVHVSLGADSRPSSSPQSLAFSECMYNRSPSREALARSPGHRTHVVIITNSWW